MSTPTVEPARSLPAFSNEPVADFSKPANRQAMEQALREVRAQLGREYDLLIAGRREKTGDKLKSLEPVAPVRGGRHAFQGVAATGERSSGSAYTFFPQWAATPAGDSGRNAC